MLCRTQLFLLCFQRIVPIGQISSICIYLHVENICILVGVACNTLAAWIISEHEYFGPWTNPPVALNADKDVLLHKPNSTISCINYFNMKVVPAAFLLH